MNYKIVLFALSLFFMTPYASIAADGNKPFGLSMRGSQVAFFLHAPSGPMGGELKNCVGTVQLNPRTDRVENISLRCALDSASWDPRLPPAMLFIAQQLSQAMRGSTGTFHSEKIEYLTPDTFKVSGTLTVGNNKELITLPVTQTVVSHDVLKLRGKIEGPTTLLATNGSQGLRGTLKMDLEFNPR